MKNQTVEVQCSSRSSGDPAESGVTLRVIDETSRETVVEISFTFEQFARVVMNQVTPGIAARFGQLERVGLTPMRDEYLFDSYDEKAAIDETVARLSEPGHPLVRVSSSRDNRGKTKVTRTTWVKL